MNEKKVEADPQCVWDADEVISRITETLRSQTGEALAETYNEICGGAVVYLGDSLFDADEA